MSVDLEKYRRAPGTTPRVDLSKYRKQPAPFRYAQPDRQERMNQYNEDARLAANEAQSTSTGSVGGFLKNFGKSLVSTVASSETGLGKSIAGILRPVNKDLAEAQQKGSATSADLVKRIREAKAEGRDTSRLERAFNMQADQNQSDTKNIVGELPSNQKVVGQIAGTGLSIISAGTYGKAKGALAGMETGKLAPKASTLPSVLQGLRATASKPAGAFTAKGAGRIAGGTALGYGFDVTQGLQGERGQDREGVNALIPGAGTAIGFALPAATEGAQSIRNVASKSGRIERTIQKRTTAIDDLGKRYAKVDRAFEAAEKKGVDVRGILSRTDLLNGAVDTNGMISSDKALSNFDTMIAPYESKVREQISKEARRVSKNDIARQADEFMKSTRLLGDDRTQLENKILAELQAFTKDSDVVPVELFHDRKVQLGGRNNYMDPDKNAITKEVTRFFKELVENNTFSMNVKNYNAELSNLYSIRDVIEAMDRTRVKGGRLGRYFASVVGGAAGGAAGGPFGVIAGAEAGAAAQGLQMSRTFGGNIPDKLEAPKGLMTALSAKATGKKAIPDVIMPKARSEVQDLDLQSKSRGSLNIAQTTNATTPISPNSAAMPSSVAGTRKPSSKMPTESAFGGLAGLEDTDGDGKPDSFSPEAALLGIAGMTFSKKFHKDDANHLSDFAYASKPTARQIQIAREIFQRAKMQVPKNTKDFQAHVRDMVESEMYKQIQQSLGNIPKDKNPN